MYSVNDYDSHTQVLSSHDRTIVMLQGHCAIAIETIIRPEYTKYTKKNALEYARTPIFVRARIHVVLSAALKWAPGPTRMYGCE